MSTKRIAAAAIAGLLLVPVTATTAPAASSNRASCVTKAELAKVKVGMTKSKVKQVIGNNGKSFDEWGGWVQIDASRSSHSPHFQVRIYKPCAPYSAEFSEVTVTYRYRGEERPGLGTPVVVGKHGGWEL